MRRRAGFTMLELIVALAIMGLGFAVAGLAFRESGTPSLASTSPADRVREARRVAFVEGRSVTTIIEAGGRFVPITALPDGRLVGATAVALSPIHGGALSPAPDRLKPLGHGESR